MTTEAFIAIIEQCTQLGPDRQQRLIADAVWMTPKERQTVADSAQKTVDKIHQNNVKIEEDLDKISSAVRDFEREELPKLRAQEESSEQEASLEEAEHLLDEL